VAEMLIIINFYCPF